MNKNTAKTLLANAAKAQGLKVQVRAGKTADDVRVLNASTGKVVAEGTIKLDNTGYVSSDVRKTVNQINVKLGKSKINSSRRRKMNSSCHGRKRLNSADDIESVDYAKDDAEFVDDVESIITDEQGNEIAVDDMLVVQNPETNEISLFVPTDGDDTVPENVEVIGEVTAADSEEVLDSSRKVKKLR